VPSPPPVTLFFVIGRFAFWVFDIFGILCLVADKERTKIMFMLFGFEKMIVFIFEWWFNDFVSLGFNYGEFYLPKFEFPYLFHVFFTTKQRRMGCECYVGHAFRIVIPMLLGYCFISI
jgi:hypothetical protein